VRPGQMSSGGTALHLELHQPEQRCRSSRCRSLSEKRRHPHILHRREIGEWARRLEGAHDAERRDPVSRQGPDALAAHPDDAGRWTLETVDQVEQRGLPRTVGADERDDLPFGDAEVHVIQHLETAEALADADALEEGGHHECPLLDHTPREGVNAQRGAQAAGGAGAVATAWRASR